MRRPRPIPNPCRRARRPFAIARPPRPPADLRTTRASAATSTGVPPPRLRPSRPPDRPPAGPTARQAPEEPLASYAFTPRPLVRAAPSRPAAARPRPGGLAHPQVLQIMADRLLTRLRPCRKRYIATLPTSLPSNILKLTLIKSPC
ncbi:hypothetical protein DL764_010189 [Monosporascus ibericus]|uniref:Uncharacterized protein n=1 Tax=Monosporascus ibericus TaxID=155417 RepID=A0A4Q4SVV9_9PEZI|nr:hypothetical protein DL764_010189 [Monosporascus ibericus]